MTSPELAVWPPPNPAFRRSEVSAVMGSGDDLWERATRDVLRWKVKTASGFSLDSRGPVRQGEKVLITASLLGVSIEEPIEVVAVVKTADRVGFAYRTRPGHPVNGEEAFIVHRDGGEVQFTVRSLTRAAPQQPWRTLYPLLLIAQRFARKRYLRALG
ncbi:DUF1990 domain-containing protein [Arthrobacter sp. NPDC089319]|uniref:DUF1990 family protein n=1 Tax=Arthrobacter sp. NPDC089319 TaxID=3155915 RepID=UPI0034469AC6